MFISFTLMINLIKPTFHLSTPMFLDLLWLVIRTSNNKNCCVSQQSHNHLHKRRRLSLRPLWYQVQHEINSLSTSISSTRYADIFGNNGSTEMSCEVFKGDSSFHCVQIIFTLRSCELKQTISSILYTDPRTASNNAFLTHTPSLWFGLAA